ncbi:MAG: hypothetical protein K2P49_04375 [Oscillospiraceae bacterium]|nr:hypothetical protein [Oscillospiraceae bacterium]
MSTMPDYTGWMVRASAGRDKDGLFCVVGVDQEGKRLLLADGKRRRIARPKGKGLNHVKLLTDGFDHPAIQRLKQGEALSDKALRRALAVFRDQLEV